MNSNLFGLPTWFVIIGIIILLSFIVILVIRAMKEGREISFWPPRIGQKPSSENLDKQINANLEKPLSPKIILEDTDDSIAEVFLKSSPIGLLQITSGDHQGICILLTEGSRKIVIGRKNADISTGDIKMSTMHCAIGIEPSENNKKGERDYKIVLWDFGSSNGTYLNGKQIRDVQKLKNGDLIQTGGTRFLVRLLD